MSDGEENWDEGIHPQSACQAPPLQKQTQPQESAAAAWRQPEAIEESAEQHKPDDSYNQDLLFKVAKAAAKTRQQQRQRGNGSPEGPSNVMQISLGFPHVPPCFLQGPHAKCFTDMYVFDEISKCSML